MYRPKRNLLIYPPLGPEYRMQFRTNREWDVQGLQYNLQLAKSKIPFYF